MNLQDLGWDAFFADAFGPYEGDNLIPARVSARHHGPCELLTEQGPMGGIPAGKLSEEELPAVGDWVAVRPVDGERKAVIEAVLPRRTSFTRKEAFQRTVAQVVAANVDTVFVTHLHGDHFGGLPFLLCAFGRRKAQPALVAAPRHDGDAIGMQPQAARLRDLHRLRDRVELVSQEV